MNFKMTILAKRVLKVAVTLFFHENSELEVSCVSEIIIPVYPIHF